MRSATRAISRNLSRAGSSPRTAFFQQHGGGSELVQQRRRSGDLCRYHVSTTHNPLLDSVFAEVRNTENSTPRRSTGIAWTTDFIGLEKITYQVGYIGGYSSFIAMTK